MTLGWVYQYWNDPEREALDAKLNAGGKVEPHEIASKTQMFTERYMVDWLLQNSLGPMWLAMCKKHGWTPEVEADGTLDRARSAARRVASEARGGRGRADRADAAPHRRRAALGLLRAAADPRRRGRARARERARPEAPRPGGGLGALPRGRLRSAGRALPGGGAAPRRGGRATLERRAPSSSASSRTTSTASTSTRAPCRSPRPRCGSRRSRLAPDARAASGEPGGVEPEARRVCPTTTRRWSSCGARWSGRRASRAS